MKAYLQGATIFRERETKDKGKGRNKRENSRHKDPSPCLTTKIRLQSDTDMPSDHNRRKNHQRVKTDLCDRKSHKNDQSQPLNKTHSKTRLKTQIASYNSHTIKLGPKEQQKSGEVENNPLWGIVKERLLNQGKTKRNQGEHPVVRKLLELTQKAKGKGYGGNYKNPQEIGVKELHKSMEAQVHDLRLEITKEGKNGRQLGLLDVLKEMVSNARCVSQATQKRQDRLLTKVRDLEDRNIRLLELMNKLKMEGVDVDSFWNHQPSQ